MKIEPTSISSLEEIVDSAEKEIGADFALNYVTSNLITISDIKNKSIQDVHEEALLWAAEVKPAELQINHGSFIKSGLDHITHELKHKKTSNRALFSLISHDDIVGTEDQPIPSFMIMQCNIHNNTLYCTSYFRALEVSKFLRVNLEEIRLKICKIHDKLPDFEYVNLTIVAFRAYVNKNINTLRIPEIDRTSPIQIYKLLNENPKKLAYMLREKSLSSTFVTTSSLEHLLEALNSGVYPKLNVQIIQNSITNAIAIANNLSARRKISSHHADIENLNQEFHDKIVDISEELGK
ncbi:hypothetical protein [Pseudomonas sp. R16(2017)]|uniref:hypothetical protein n=1 Tax=Pseudomonas sp. R16(2017) TaxID=1981704 RepID=UPI00111C8AD1|nr:hypothetical protein [Pseudomonas sp. R16(2017)]